MEMQKPEGKVRGFQHLLKDLVNHNALKNNVGLLLLHKFNDINYIYENMALYLVTVSINRWLDIFINIHVQGQAIS